jgi:nucleotide-binding universal stress UspA family protein
MVVFSAMPDNIRPATGRVPAVYDKILVGTDGSSTAGRAVDRAVEVAAATGAALTILSAGNGAKAQRAVAEAAAQYASSGVQIETVAREGDPATVLIEQSERGYDLLVVGNKGMTGASRFFLGSVPNKISHHSPCALLIVHTV